MRRDNVGQTLATGFDPRWNSLNALRLLFAVLVIVSHAWPLGGFGGDPQLGSATLGTWAVEGFFVVSGFLIAGSRLRSSLAPYLWRRFLRIFPGLWTCLLVTGLVLAPIAAVVEHGDDRLGLGAIASFVLRNGVLQRGHVQIGGTLSALPFPSAWNGSLWTLFYEFGCYLALGALLCVTRSGRRPRQLIVGAFVALAAVDLGVTELGIGAPDNVATFAHLGMYFFAGAVLCAFADRVPVRGDLAAGCAVILIGSALARHDLVLAALPLAYLSLWCGIRLPFQSIGRRNDVSYGVYIYAFPVQQLLALAHAPRLGVAAYIALSIVCTAPFAVASWFAIERPAMRLKSRSPFGGLRLLSPAVTPPREAGGVTESSGAG